MNRSRRTRATELALLVSVVPKMRRHAPKRNLVVGLVYVLLLWVVGARLLFVV